MNLLIKPLHTRVMSDKTLGERAGEAMDAVKSKVNEVADRTRAEGHEAKAETTNNPVERAVEKTKGAVDNAKADGHEAQAHVQSERAKE